MSSSTYWQPSSIAPRMALSVFSAACWWYQRCAITVKCPVSTRRWGAVAHATPHASDRSAITRSASDILVSIDRTWGSARSPAPLQRDAPRHDLALRDVELERRHGLVTVDLRHLHAVATRRAHRHEVATGVVPRSGLRTGLAERLDARISVLRPLHLRVAFAQREDDAARALEVNGVLVRSRIEVEVLDDEPEALVPDVDHDGAGGRPEVVGPAVRIVGRRVQAAAGHARGSRAIPVDRLHLGIRTALVD